LLLIADSFTIKTITLAGINANAILKMDETKNPAIVDYTYDYCKVNAKGLFLIFRLKLGFDDAFLIMA
jgi:hypothetical protein